MKKIRTQTGAMVDPIATLGEEIAPEIADKMREAAEISVRQSGRFKRATIWVQGHPMRTMVSALFAGLLLGAVIQRSSRRPMDAA